MQYEKHLQNDQTSLNKNGKEFCDMCIHLSIEGTGHTPASLRGMNKSTRQKKNKGAKQNIARTGKS